MPSHRLPDPYDGRPIVKVQVKVTNVGDGLSTAVATDALTFHHGERVTLVIDCDVAGTDIRPLDKEDLSGPQVARYVLQGTGRATFVDSDSLSDVLDAQQRRNDEARGRPQLPLDADDGEGPDGIPAALAAEDDPSVPSPDLVDVEEPTPITKAKKGRAAAMADF